MFALKINFLKPYGLKTYAHEKKIKIEKDYTYIERERQTHASRGLCVFVK